MDTVLHPCISPDDAELLIQPITSEEIQSAVSSLASNRAPGIDGLTGSFFKRYWSTISSDVVAAILYAFEKGQLPQSWKDTAVTLVPKIYHASEAKHFRPISLCNTIYKIIAKILIHRLKPLLPSLISIEQGAFIPGRSISDNCILAQELIHKLHTSEASNGLFLIKADMEQTFDRISWLFLDRMLNIMTFPPTWRKWIMMCVTNPRYTILINGRRSAWITAKWGLRQGCPLSPYLFIICSEFLSHLIRHKVASGCLHGIRLSPRGSPHHHLLFANDVLLCAEADINSVTSLNWALTSYCTISGQKVNVDKSSILFSPKTPRHRRSSIRCCFDMREESNWTYLGIPLRKRRPSKDDFTDLLAKIRNRIHSWGTRQLSLAGRLTLINSVLSSTPVYILSHIFVPCSVLDCIEKLLRSFFWGGNGDTNTMHYLPSKDVCKPKSYGGLGIHDLRHWRKQLLAKHAAKLLQKDDCIWRDSFIAKYKDRALNFSAKKRRFLNLEINLS
ncbi:Putative ribonuclease H protein [Apostasia shenzhenica]|uniref:Ribonuclease H protein n=1 Tax=Apostasia shenzhenica TaxID=1088818 RepID=A0A2I0AYF5_9ASPA|nr:Putative ribonuclease H protein [Apostasia shenzhenica]